MNIFVLNTGRCGSTTFIKACRHISNYSCAHESRTGLLGDAHFDYPKNHIEADNRLSWFLGRIERSYGNNAVYIHLKRNDNDTARSFVKRLSFGIINAYRETILLNLPEKSPPFLVALDYCDTVNSNIELFLKDKTKKMNFKLENAKQDFQKFWELIGAEGNMDAALAEFNVFHNASSQSIDRTIRKSPLPLRILRKLNRLAVKLPDYIKNA